MNYINLKKAFYFNPKFNLKFFNKMKKKILPFLLYIEF